MSQSCSPTVAIVQEALAHFRLPFYDRLEQELADRNIRLRLIYGQKDGAAYHNGLDAAWAHPIQNRTLRMGHWTLYWQPCLSLLRDADLVIVEQASKLLLNYLLLVRQATGRQRVAFWGHGRNLQAAEASPLGEWVKATLSTRVHWWFAYNDHSSEIVRALGFPDDRITSVQNALDTRALTEAHQRMPASSIEALRRKLDLKGQNVCLYVGRMYPAKRLDFLLEACHHIRAQVSDFEMIFIGSGNEAPLVSAACASHDWMHYVGPHFGMERVPYFRLSKLLLMPGLVGLAVLDAFSMEAPLVTTRVPFHSPEIDYLRSGVNGFIVEDADSAEAYAQAVVSLLYDEDRRQCLVSGCRRARTVYTVEEMARRFAAGIEQALQLSTRPSVQRMLGKRPQT